MREEKYYCEKCGIEHLLDSPRGMAHFPRLRGQDPARFLEFVGTAGTWEFVRQGLPGVFEGTAQYAGDISVFRRLNEEFLKTTGTFASAENAQAYAREIGAESFTDLPQHLQNKVQGAIGEVQHLTQRQESLRYWFNSLTEGNAKMIDGTSFDLLQMKTQAFQTKASLSLDDPGRVAREFSEHVVENPAVHLNGRDFLSRDIVFGANKEVLDSYAGHTMTNPIEQVGTASDIRETAERLVDKMQAGDAFSSLLVAETLTKIGQGAAIGAAISVGISSYLTYRKYKAGEVSFDEAYRIVGKEGLKGAVVGGTLAGLSLIVPGGIIGLGVGLAVGMSMRRIIDVGFGEGSYKAILNAEGTVLISLQEVSTQGAVLAAVAATDQLILRNARASLLKRRQRSRALEAEMAVLESKLSKL